MEDISETNRPKRQKRESSYKSKAFERFKALKSGNRNKYEVDEVENIYDTVNEKDYVKTVLTRQDDDWIVDDDGSGYVEDGRDIFDDDLDYESITAASSSKGKGTKRKKKAVSENAGKGNLQLMLSKMPTSKKKADIPVDDSMLSEILDEINEVPTQTPLKSNNQPVGSMLVRKKAELAYVSTFTVPARKYTLKKTPNKSFTKNLNEKAELTIDSLPNSTKISTNSPPIEKNASEIKSKNVAIDESEKCSGIEDHKLNETESMSIDVDNSEALFREDIDFDQIEQFDSQVEQTEELDNSEDNILSAFLDQQETFEDDAVDSVVNIPLDSKHIPLVDGGKDDKVFRFFYWDAYEDIYVRPGVVFLFGKTFCEETKSYVSCCVVVQNVQRRLFVLPRPYKLDESGKPTDSQVTHKDVYMEFNSTKMKPLKISGYKSRFVQKKYAFDASIPAESDYMEVRYSAKDPRISTSGEEKTFSKIFGLNSSYLEIFLLERKIKGPCWLDIHNPEPVSNPVSWCKFEINVQISSQVNFTPSENNSPPPPLVVATINIKFALNPKTLTNEIAMISCIAHTKYALDKPPPNPVFQKDFCVFRAPQHVVLPPNTYKALTTFKRTQVQKMDSERALLNYFITKFHSIDPDLVVGHDLQGYQFSILSDRLFCNNISNFSKFCRLKRTKLNQKMEKTLFIGRLVCDIKISTKECIKSRSYDLNTLCQTVLNFKEGNRIDLETDDIPKMFHSTDNLLKLIALSLTDSCCILRIMYNLNIIPLALQITNIAGNIMSRTLTGGRSERNEYLLLHAFSEKDYIVPDKVYNKNVNENRSTAAKKKPAYSGGLVLDPKVGFYDTFILLMDFNSLYPSIIQEYNICFTTLPPGNFDENMVLPDKSVPAGVLPIEIRKLVESRREVKKLMKTVDKRSDSYMQYNIRQTALKLTANSMYGCLGFVNSRFYAQNLAALITHKGREILVNTKDLVQKLSFEVLYGDTDSIMINTNIADYDQVYKIGNKIKQEVNKLYKQVELDIDGVFKYLLLLKKKKYAAVTVTKIEDNKMKCEKEYKGLEIVRRDWSKIACEAGKIVLDQILSDQNSDDRIANIQTHLTKIKDDMENNKIPLSLLVITKQLTKNPTMYTDKNSLPHVQVALRYNKQSGGHFRAGDTVPYVICEDGTDNTPTQRAYHLDELKNSDNKLAIDVNYYLAQQIHPVVARICEPIDGLDSYQLAEWLSIDTTSFKRSVTQRRELPDTVVVNENRLRDALPFVFKCYDCKQTNAIDGALRGFVPILTKCTNSECNVRPIDYLPYIQNQLIIAIRRYVEKYYLNELICEDPACDNEMVRLPLKFAEKYPICTLCKRGVMYKKYTETNLYFQLSYLCHIFDLSKLDKRPLLEEQVENGYHCLRETVEKYLNHSGFFVINLSELFSGFTVRDRDQEPIEEFEQEYYEFEQFNDDDDDEV